MSTLEEEIIAKFYQLDVDARKRVLHRLHQHINLTSPKADSFNFDAWMQEVEAIQHDIRTRLGEDATVGGLDLLNELREESS